MHLFLAAMRGYEEILINYGQRAKNGKGLGPTLWSRKQAPDGHPQRGRGCVARVHGAQGVPVCCCHRTTRFQLAEQEAQEAEGSNGHPDSVAPSGPIGARLMMERRAPGASASSIMLFRNLCDPGRSPSCTGVCFQTGV